MLPSARRPFPSVREVALDVHETFPREVELRDGVGSAAASTWYRRAFQEAPAGMAIVALDGRFLRVNRAFSHMLGYTREELQSRTIPAVTHPDDTDRSLQCLQEMISGEIDQIDLVKRYLHKGGSVLWAGVHSAVVRDPTGKALYFVVQVRDITESITTRLTLEQRGAVLEAVAFAADRFLNGIDWEKEIVPVLAKMGGAVGADRVTMWEDRRQGDDLVAELRFEWVAAGVDRIGVADRKDASLRDRLSNHVDAIAHDEPIFLRRSGSSAEEKRVLERIGAQAVLVVPVLIDGRLWGHLGFHACEKERDWSLPVLDAVHVAARLVGAAITRQDSMATLRDFARRTVSAREEEGRRISRRIHDELGQSLTVLKIDLASQRRSADDAEKLDRMMAMVDDAIARLRDIAAELRPPILDDLGIVGAMEWVTDEFRRRTGIECELDVPEDLRVDGERSIALYRILQEALTNVARHAEAGRVTVTLEPGPDGYALEVRDDGKGMSGGAVEGRSTLGIVGMRERAESCGGVLTIESELGRGTTVRAVLPPQEPPSRPEAR